VIFVVDGGVGIIVGGLLMIAEVVSVLRD